MSSEVFSGGVKGYGHDGIWLKEANSLQVGIEGPKQEAMIPGIFKPLAEDGLDDREVQDAANGIEVTSAGEGEAVAMAMEVTAFAFMTDDTVTAVNLMVTGDRSSQSP